MAEPRRGRRLALVLVLVLLVVAGADIVRRVAEGEVEQSAAVAFYSVPTPLPPGAPGEIIRREPLASAPFASRAWRVVYHSRDEQGRDIAVSGAVVVPDLPTPAGGRTVVSWAHPTTGSADHCAPTLGLDPFLDIEGLHELLAAGYAVAATDYPGMGVAGASSYLLAVPESNSVLDAARAARQILGAESNGHVVLWGHSQGGQAALVAAERASSYASDLTLDGVAVAAPAADLTTLMTDNIDTMAGVTIASYAISAYRAAYAGRYAPATLDAILTPAGVAQTPALDQLCLLTQGKRIHDLAEPLIGHYVRSNPATTEPWATLLRDNSAGGRPITVPVFVGQGLADSLVDPSATAAYVRSLCSQGADVSAHTYPGIDHAFAAYASVPELLAWLSPLDGGRTPRSTC